MRKPIYTSQPLDFTWLKVRNVVLSLGGTEFCTCTEPELANEEAKLQQHPWSASSTELPYERGAFPVWGLI